MRLMKRWMTYALLITLVSGIAHTELEGWRKRLSNSPFTVGINPLNPNSVYTQAGGGLIFVSYNRGGTWLPLGNPRVSQVRQIIVHPSDTTIMLCMAFSGGIQRSSDYGATWFTVLPNVGIDGESMAYNPLHPDTIYAGNFFDGRVFRSTDRGLFWSPMGITGTELCALAVRPDSGNILLAGTGGGTISKSTDGGATWRQVKEGGSLEIPRIVVSPTNPMTLYGTAYAGQPSATGIWKSTDGGEHWFLTALHSSVWSVDVDFTNPDIVYAGTFGYNNYAAVFKSTNGGESWDSLYEGFPGTGDGWSLKVHPMDPSVVWLALVGPRGGIYRWQTTETVLQGAVLHAVTGDTVRIGSVRIIETGDSVNLGATGGQFAFGYFDGDPTQTPQARIVAYPYYVRNEPLAFLPDSTTTHNVQLTELPRSAISGVVRDSVTQQPLQAIVTLASSTPIGVSTSTTATKPDGSYRFDSLHVSETSVVRYERLTFEASLPYEQAYATSLILDTTGLVVSKLLDTADVLLAGPSGSGNLLSPFGPLLDSIHVSVHYWDSGVSGPAPLSKSLLLRKRSVIYSTGALDSPLSEAEIESLNVCLNNGVSVFLSGRNLVEHNDSSTLLLDYVHVAYAGNSPFLGLRGVTNDLFSNQFATVFSSAPRDSLYVTSTAAKPVLNYQVLGPRGIAAVRIDALGNRGRIILFAFPLEGINSVQTRRTLLQRVIGYFDGSITVGVDDAFLNEPTGFHLSQNYPNPFNPSTRIVYRVESREFVELRVFDALGQRVATLVNEVKEPGEYSVTLSTEGGYASGVYFYQLRAGKFQQTKKLLILR